MLNASSVAFAPVYGGTMISAEQEVWLPARMIASRVAVAMAGGCRSSATEVGMGTFGAIVSAGNATRSSLFASAVGAKVGNDTTGLPGNVLGANMSASNTAVAITLTSVSPINSIRPRTAPGPES
jgi:hypothetical protein